MMWNGVLKRTSHLVYCPGSGDELALVLKGLFGVFVCLALTKSNQRTQLQTLDASVHVHNLHHSPCLVLCFLCEVSAAITFLSKYIYV
jgi:hypothetical protein